MVWTAGSGICSLSARLLMYRRFRGFMRLGKAVYVDMARLGKAVYMEMARFGGAINLISRIYYRNYSFFILHYTLYIIHFPFHFAFSIDIRQCRVNVVYIN